MKPPQVLAIVALAVLATAAVQEYRISALREKFGIPEDGEIPEVVSVVESPVAGDPAGPEKTKSTPEVRIEVPVVEPAIMGESFVSNARKMWENPAGKSMMSQGAKVAVALMYQDFIDGMKLSKEEGDYFKNLLGREVSSQQELGMKMMGATPDERKELADELAKRSEETKEEVRKFLNNEDDFKAFNDYKERIPERQQLEGIRTALTTKGVPIDEQTETKLVEAMYRARTEAKAPDFSGPNAMEDLAKGNLVESFEKTWVIQQESLLKETSGILSPEQVVAFEEYRQQMKEMQMMQMKMAEQMMSGEDKSGE